MSLREWCRVLIFCRQGCGQYSVSDGLPVYLWAMTVFVLQLASPPVLLILSDTLRVLVECESRRLELLQFSNVKVSIIKQTCRSFA